jgi:hypothetical protein
MDRQNFLTAAFTPRQQCATPRRHYLECNPSPARAAPYRENFHQMLDDDAALLSRVRGDRSQHRETTIRTGFHPVMRPSSLCLTAPAVLLLAILPTAVPAGPITDEDEAKTLPFVLAIEERVIVRIEGFFDAANTARAEMERARRSLAEASQRADAAERNASVAEEAAERAEKIAAAETAKEANEAAVAVAKAARARATSAAAIAKAEKDAFDAAAKAAVRVASKLKNDTVEAVPAREREEAAAEREARRKARQAARADGRKARGRHEEPDRDLGDLVSERPPVTLEELAASLVIDAMATTGSALASTVVPILANSAQPSSESPAPSTSSTLLASLPLEKPLSLDDIVGREERIAGLADAPDGPLTTASMIAAQSLAGVTAQPTTTLSIIAGLIGMLLMRRNR